MTCLEKYKMDFPGVALCGDGCPTSCPRDHGYKSAYHETHYCYDSDDCRKCWAAEDLNDIQESNAVDFDKLSPVEKAYQLMIGFCHEGKTTDLEEVIGYLGEALSEHTEEYTVDGMREKIQEIAKDEFNATVTFKDRSADTDILDSGDRTQFESGAVRDMREGKGRCDLMPLEVVAECMPDPRAKAMLQQIRYFQKSNDAGFLMNCIGDFARHTGHEYNYLGDMCTTFLEVAKHFEEGAKKYGANNWQKGIPVYCYIDSAVRHYLKWLRGDKDEPHDRAFVWNLMCCIWEVDHGEQWRSHIKT